MTSLSKPNWRFAARNGGIDYVNDPSSAHFSDDPIAKLVRESIQNALDAKHDGYADPVTVTFTETSVRADLIGAASLQRHLRSCLDKISGDRPDIADIYTNALSVIRRSEVPCLKIQDTGTVGLNDERWKALVLQEGAVSKSGGAPGGSYGIGKNAMLNVSDLQTVFYSTRLVEGRKGRVTKLQGKATLTGHPDPDGSSEDLQHIGFYSAHNGRPLMGNDIPKFFRLEETGTGVFVLGFNPHSTGWVDQVATAVIENFFYAVHHQYLTVEILPEDQDPVRIDILCEPGPEFSSDVFEAGLREGARSVSDDDFGMWQRCPINEPELLPSERFSAEIGGGEWIPQARDPRYLWLHYKGNKRLITSDEQRERAYMDLQVLDVPPGLTKDGFNDWLRLSLHASEFMNAVKQFAGQTEAFIWDRIAEDWGTSRAIASRWVSTADIWLRYLDPNTGSIVVQAGKA